MNLNKNKVLNNTSNSVEYFVEIFAMFSSNTLTDSSTCFKFSVDLEIPDCKAVEGKDDWVSEPLIKEPPFTFRIPASNFATVTLSVFSNLPSAGFAFNS